MSPDDFIFLHRARPFEATKCARNRRGDVVYLISKNKLDGSYKVKTDGYYPYEYRVDKRHRYLNGLETVPFNKRYCDLGSPYDLMEVLETSEFKEKIYIAYATCELDHMGRKKKNIKIKKGWGY